MASEDEDPDELRIVLVGASGSGKSATGNTILRKRAFTIGQSWDPETLTCQRERGEFEGTPVSVVDTPSVIMHNTTEMSKCISYCPSGPHAFLLVMPLQKFTDVECQVKNLQQTFGEGASRYTIVLFTSGGEQNAGGVTTEQFIRQSQFPYGVGYHVFNRDEDPSQVRELLEKIKRMVQRNGGSYCIEFKDWDYKYLYPFASAVAIGCGIGAASGGTGDGALFAAVGSAVGAISAAGGNRAVVRAVVDTAAGAVVGAVAVALVVALVVVVTGIREFVVAVVLGLAVAVSAAGIVVAKPFEVPYSEVALVAVARDVLESTACAGVAFGALARARAIFEAGSAAAAVGLADALRGGIVTGAETAINTAGAIITGAGADGAALQMFDDRNIRVEAIWGIIGGAAAGAGVSAAVRVHDVSGHVFAIVIGMFIVFGALSTIVIKSDATINKIVGCAIVAAESIGAAFGAAVGVEGASSFAAGVIISIACKALTWHLNIIA